MTRAQARPCRFVFASDSFKGSLTSEDTAQLLAQAAGECLPGSAWTAVPLCDGGEGTARALAAACGGALRTCRVHGPYGAPVEAQFAILPGGRAVVEMAAAAGLPLVPASGRNLPRASTYGVGQLVAAALDAGCSDITVALGGSATNDGGMGMLQALGVRFLGAAGAELPGCGASLAAVREVDASGLDARVKQARFTAMCDVDNPLTGPDGATFTFGPQKLGAGDAPGTLDGLEAGMHNYRDVLARVAGADVGAHPGAGAAGGLGAACLAFLGARLEPGIQRMLDLVGFDTLLSDADLCVTGEGRLDAQTAHGKAVAGVAAACAARGVPCVAIVGGMEPDAATLPGLTAAVPLPLAPATLDECLEHARENYLLAARRAFSLFAAGRAGRA